MARHTFTLASATGDTRLIARMGYGYDWNYFADAEDIVFGADADGRIRWSTGDADNHALVLALGDTNEALHITDVGAIATDWAVAADTHPTVYIHSNTTPATDYMTIGAHDGTTGFINVVGGTTLAIAIAGTTEFNVTAASINPNANDGLTLGTATVSFADLFLASGALINFNNGNFTVTHSAGLLTFSGDVTVSGTFTPAIVSNATITATTDFRLGGAAGAATTTRKIVIKTTAIADAVATGVITVTVPNANHAAVIKLTFLSSNGSTDAFESSRTAYGAVVLARTTGVATVATAVALTNADIATVGAGATHTLAYDLSAIAGAVGVTQTFNIQVTINDSGNLGGNQCVTVAEVINAEATGVTIAAV